ncbi:MAG TPA: DUF4214 domain-containing protein, partial [Gemmataceae bacterium]|nr:DUF4214 domain-containing protein [Gemmataceae bacterium]
MAPLRSLLRRPRANDTTSRRLPKKWLGLRLEQLEDRILMAQNALAAPLVDGLYQTVLGRTPKNGEDAGWIAALQNGALTPGQVARDFVASPEYRAGLVSRTYETLLGRAPEAGAVDNWLTAMNANGDASLFTGIL